MKQNVSKILQRQLLLMGYKSNNTLSENLEQIKNKPFIVEQGAADRYTNYINSEQGLEQHDIDQANEVAKTYPNYCWNNGEGTVVPGKNEHGLSGADAIPIGENGQMFCAYRGAGNKMLFLPVNATDIYIMKGDIEEYDGILTMAEKDPQDPMYMINDDEIKKIFSEYMTSTYIKGSVFNFTINGLEFGPMKRKILPGDVSGGKVNPKTYYKFIGYYNDVEKIYYENPKWIDPRNEYQKFVDDFGTWVQIGAAVVTAIAGLFCEGCSWPITVEIITELGLGIWVAQREFEKGDNIAGTASLIFGLLPMLKLTKWFPGVSDDVFKSLAKRFAESGLQTTDDVADYIVFYSKLSNEEKMLLSKLLKQDDVNRNKMLKEIAEALGKESAGTIDDGLKALIKTNRNILKDISFFKRLWVRELGSNAAIILITTIMELVCGKETKCFGKKLNDTEKMKFSKLYTFMPDNTKMLLVYNCANNPEITGEIITGLDNAIDGQINTEDLKGSFSDWCKENIEEVVIENGGTFYDIEDPTATNEDDYSFDSSPEIITPEKLDSLKQSGYMEYGEYLECCREKELDVYPTNYKIGNDEMQLVKPMK